MEEVVERNEWVGGDRGFEGGRCQIICLALA